MLREKKKDLHNELVRVADSWKTAEQGARWVQEHILDEKPNAEALFAHARDAKVEEILREEAKREGENL